MVSSFTEALSLERRQPSNQAIERTSGRFGSSLFYKIPPLTGSDALSRQPSLILFSLDRMALRPSIAFVTLAVVVGAAVAASGSMTTLRSQGRSVSISVTAPVGFSGPAHKTWPSYDEFSFAHGEDPRACYLQIRFAPYTDEPGDRHSANDIAIHWNTTPLPEIRAQLAREFQNPRVERIATVRVGEETVRVYAVYNVDGQYYAADIRRGGTVISFSLRSESRRELERHKAGFLSFLRSVQIGAI
jgi:hypothetical protein